MIPVPGLRVDGFSYTAEDLQGRLVILCHMLVACPYEGSDQSRRCVELLHLQDFRCQHFSRRYAACRPITKTGAMHSSLSKPSSCFLAPSHRLSTRVKWIQFFAAMQ